jgi:hypothetical protein
VARTPYTESRGDFTNRGHVAAQRLIYPVLFGTDAAHLHFESTLVRGGDEREKLLDGELGIDRIVRVEVSGQSWPMVFTIQERFRSVEQGNFSDVTLTESSDCGKRPSELYKIIAGLFVYAVFDEKNDAFLNVRVVDVPKLLLAVTHGRLKFTCVPTKKNQRMACFETRDLEKNGTLLFTRDVLPVGGSSTSSTVQDRRAYLHVSGPPGTLSKRVHS